MSESGSVLFTGSQPAAAPTGSGGSSLSGTTAAGVGVAAGAAALLATTGGTPDAEQSVLTSTSTSLLSPVVPVSNVRASRFLAQASTGASKADINAVAAGGFARWLDDQFAMARPQTFVGWLDASGVRNDPLNVSRQVGLDSMIWAQLMGSPDTLRQRIGMALLSLWPISPDSLRGWPQYTVAAYLDILWDNAFGNYRDLMEQVSTNVAMGQFLTHLGSTRATDATQPDENFARELMQLFTIGLVMLNQDGTPVLRNGAPVETYSLTDVRQLARVWTGYEFPARPVGSIDRFIQPMGVNESLHEPGASTFLGISIPAGNTAASSRKIALDGLFNHPNVPPFVSRQLIQRFVTSNPSPAYVARVAAVFANNGNGIRGDLKAVVRAILMDREARDDSTAIRSTTFGKLREPVLRLTGWAKACRVTSPNNRWDLGSTVSSVGRLGQSPARSPSVFNWFRPGYTPPGTNLASAGLVAPEFQIVTEQSVVGYVNYIHSLVVHSGTGDVRVDYSWLEHIALDNQALLAELNLVLAAGQISDVTLARMKTALDTIELRTDGIGRRIRAAMVLIMACSEYLVQK